MDIAEAEVTLVIIGTASLKHRLEELPFGKGSIVSVEISGFWQFDSF